jgi:phospho-N-acetylmuramoyl-pentapeptide-transferase
VIYTNVDRAFVAALVSFLIALVAAPLVYRLLLRAKSRQIVSEFVPEHAQKQGTPTMGGVIVLIGLIGAFWFVPRSEVVTPLVLAVGFAMIGFVDDYLVPRLAAGTRGLGWKQKFVLQIVVAAAAYWFGGVTTPGALAFLVFFIVFFANAYNFADGMDGLAGGIGVMLALGLAVLGRLTLVDSNADMALLALMGGLATAFVPFLFYNAPPAKVFMGDVGALSIGALLGWAFLSVGRPNAGVPNDINLWGAGVMSLLLVAELVPVPLQVLSVKLRKGKRLFLRTPIHHAFQHAGWPETRVVWTFHLVQAVLVAVGIGIVWRAVG